jgi:predicted porin
VVVQNTSNDGADAAGNTANKDTSLGVNFSSGPLFLGAAWNEKGKQGTNNQEPTGIRLAGSYTFNDITLGALYETLEDLDGVTNKDRDIFGLIASIKVGNNKFKFHYLEADKYDTSTTDDGADMFAIGVDHIFSKTTLVYLNYASVSNDTGGTFNPASSPGGHGDNLASVTGKDNNAITAGYIINF